MRAGTRDDRFDREAQSRSKPGTEESPKSAIVRVVQEPTTAFTEAMMSIAHLETIRPAAVPNIRLPIVNLAIGTHFTRAPPRRDR